MLAQPRRIQPQALFGSSASARSAALRARSVWSLTSDTAALIAKARSWQGRIEALPKRGASGE